MANFRTVRGNKATDLDGRDNLYVHSGAHIPKISGGGVKFFGTDFHGSVS